MWGIIVHSHTTAYCLLVRYYNILLEACYNNTLKHYTITTPGLLIACKCVAPVGHTPCVSSIDNAMAQAGHTPGLLTAVLKKLLWGPIVYSHTTAYCLLVRYYNILLGAYYNSILKHYTIATPYRTAQGSNIVRGVFKN